MSKHTLSSLLILGALTTNAQANLTINGSHTSNLPDGLIEAYFIKADATGSVNIFLDQKGSALDGSFFNAYLSVWQLTGSNWSLIGVNNDAPEVAPYLLNSYGVTIKGGVSGIPGQGISDPGLTLNLTANTTYMIAQSEDLNQPTSIDALSVGNLGQTMPISPNYRNSFANGASAFYDKSSKPFINEYNIQINGTVSITSAPNIITKKSQTITFVATPVITVGKTNTISVSSNSKLAVSLTATPASICSLNGNNITGKAVGTCTITATQAGDANYNPTQSTKSILIGQGTQSINFGVKPSISVGKNGKITVSSSSKLTVALSAAPATVCSLKGNVLTGKAIGTCTITANQIGNSNYLAAPQKTQQITITKGSQTISFGATPTVLIGKTGNISATSTSKLPVTLTASPATVCTLKGTIITGKSIGTCTITAKQAGNPNYYPALQKTLPFKVTR